MLLGSNSKIGVLLGTSGSSQTIGIFHPPGKAPNHGFYTPGATLDVIISSRIEILLVRVVVHVINIGPVMFADEKKKF